MVWNEMAGLFVRADASIPDISAPWPVKDVSRE
jgi:chitin synthase